MQQPSALKQLSEAYGEAESSCSDQEAIEKSSEEESRVVEKDLCQVCGQQEHKYKCPACATITCSLPCVRAHKEASGCSGVKQVAPNGSIKLRLGEMSLGTIKGDMKMIEQGINMSNRAKKENILAKVGASHTLGVKPVDPKQLKKQKTLKQFLRKKRGINYFCSPSPLFARNRIN